MESIENAAKRKQAASAQEIYEALRQGQARDGGAYKEDRHGGTEAKDDDPDSSKHLAEEPEDPEGDGGGDNEPARHATRKTIKRPDLDSKARTWNPGPFTCSR